MVETPFYSSQRFGSARDFVDSLDQTDDCCGATRTRNRYGVIEWEVVLVAKAEWSRRSALVVFSNCGEVATDEGYKVREPMKARDVWK